MPNINDLEVDEYLYSCVTLDPTVITDEMSRVSADFAYWGNRYAKAHREYLRAKILDKRAKAQSYAEKRELLQATRGKATVSDIDAAVVLDETVQEAEAAVIECEYDRETLKGCLEAVRAKRDMLITLGAHMREEMKGTPRINKKDLPGSDWGDDD
jgi:DNA repair photolyase